MRRIYLSPQFGRGGLVVWGHRQPSRWIYLSVGLTTWDSGPGLYAKVAVALLTFEVGCLLYRTSR